MWMHFFLSVALGFLTALFAPLTEDELKATKEKG